MLKSGLPDWLAKTLRENGVKRLSKLSAMTDRQILELRGVGKRSVELIRAKLAETRKSGGADMR